MLFLIEPVSKTLQSPIITFVLLLAIALVVPPIFERLKLPGLVGLLVAGVVFGSSGLGWLEASDETMALFSEVGKIYLMFVAGLEIDLVLFQKTRNKALSFGALTFSIPFIFGMSAGFYFGFGWLAALLIGSLLASHTLLAYPIIQRLGVAGDEAVTITVGATIFTDVLSLVVLAVCLGISKGDFSTLKLTILVGSLLVYGLAVLVGLKALAKFFFAATGKDEGNQFLFVLLSVFLCAVGAQLVGVEGIIGAFLAGLAINSVIGDGPVKEKTEFLGSVLFIPMFFVNMGLLLDLDALGSLISTLQIPALIIGALLISKLLAALITKILFGYSWPQTWLMWSLSVPQVAATLAAALVGYEADIINAQVFNSVILLMLVTATLGPLLTAHSGRRVASQLAAKSARPLSWLPLPTEEGELAVATTAAATPTAEGRTQQITDARATAAPSVEQTIEQATKQTTKQTTEQIFGKTAEADSKTGAADTSGVPVARAASPSDFTVVVPVYNPRTERYLLALAAILASYENGRLVPLAIAPAQPQMTSPKLTRALQQSQRRLEEALSFSENAELTAKPTLRISTNIPRSICHVSREEDAQLIVLGMPSRQLKFPFETSAVFNARRRNSVHEAILFCAHCPVIVARLQASPSQLKNILLPVEALSPLTIRVLRFAQVLAAANKGRVTLLVVCSPLSSQTHRRRAQVQLERLIQQLPVSTADISIQIQVRENWIGAIAKAASKYDLVVLRDQRRKISSAVGVHTSIDAKSHSLLNQINGSVVLVGEPYAST